MILASTSPELSFADAIFTPCLASLKRFDEEVATAGYAQNRSKLVAITVVQGTGARNFVSSISKGTITPPFSCTLACKSLGSIISADLRAQPEIESRVSSVQRAYFKRGRIWTCPNVPWKLKRILLLGDIQGSALMGLESFIISPHQLGTLDKAVARVARSAMRGKAVCRDP